MSEYDAYCTADRFYYDLPPSPFSKSDSSNLFPVLREERVPVGWVRVDGDDWVNFFPEVHSIPMQGWKIHVSARLENAEDISSRVWNYCIREGIAFKLTPGLDRFRSKNTKYAPRVASGKLFTIYPNSEEQLHTTLKELGEELQGEQGPYILSDVRWGDGPLYTRYGAFAKRLSDDGEGNGRISIENPDGRLEPDPRDVVFSPPAWVEPPDFLRPHIERHRRPITDEFPYQVTEAVHFSNGGGVYKATDHRSGRIVILKEARPFAGVDNSGDDAVTRLRRERDMLRYLAEVTEVPECLGYHIVGDHEFLVQEYIEGISLYSEGVKRNPLTRKLHPTFEELHDYSSWALETWKKVASAIRKVHDRGIIFGDLHPNNIMITADERIWLIDWEVASFHSDDRRPPIGNPGFMAPEDRRGFQIDAYALALMKLALFAPITTLSRLSPAKVWHVAELVSQAYGLEVDTFANELDSVAGSREAALAHARSFARDEMAQQAGTWATVRADIAEAILESATPDREDRLFPGDIAQFTSAHGGLGSAHGAAGVLWTLRQTQKIRYPEGEQWLRERAMAERDGASRGFYEGDHGIAYALHSLGYENEATELLERVHRKGQDRVSIDLRKGAAGIGLNWLHFYTATGDERYLQRAVHTAQELGPRLSAVPDHDPYSSARSPGGLVDGFSGAALFLIRMYEVTGDKGYLDTAADALRLDLAKCDTDPDGSLLLKDEFRVLPYLSSGSAGIGLVLRRYLEHVHAPEHSSQVTAIAQAVSSKFCVFSGLFNGRAGLVLAATSLYDPRDADFRDRVVDQVQGINWHVLHKNGRRVFPGDQLMKLSSDLATGSAGVLLALAAADQVVDECAEQPTSAVGLPFLSSR